jgi:hypothetical protein
MLRLLYGDVYCAERTFRFGLSENDKCRRCFAIETINHLLLECPYTLEVYSQLGLTRLNLNDILGVYLNRAELEIRADFLGFIVFRQSSLAPNILVQTTLERYAKGLTDATGVCELAEAKLSLIMQ